MAILGLDIGATYIKSGIVLEKGKVKNFRKIKNRSEYGEEFLINQIINGIHAYRDEFDIKKVGIGFAGSVNYKRGIVLDAPNMKNFHSLYLKSVLEQKCDVEVKLDNDAHCFGLAENIFGAGRNYQDFIVLTLGTGIGGAIIINKQLYRGANNIAGSFGHSIIDANSEVICGCGNYGHFEALAGGKALSKLYKKATDQDTEDELIAEMADRGEKIAQKSIIQIGHYFSLGIANIINVLNPEVLIVGGGLTEIELLWQTVINNFQKYLLNKELKNTKVVKSKLKDTAGVIGASLLFEEDSQLNLTPEIEVDLKVN